MNTPYYWIVAIVVALSWGAIAGADGPTDDEAARDVAADVVQARADAASAAGVR